MDGRILLGIGFGLALDVLGVLLIVSSGNAAAGVAVLAISTFIVLGVVLSRRGGSGRGGRYTGGEGFGGAWPGSDGKGGDGGDGGGFGGDAGGGGTG